jgi:hypothetical protein
VSDFWYALLFITFYIPFLFLWGFTLVDDFTRKDLHAWSKMLWALFVLFVPLIGVFAYFLTRPQDYDSLPSTSNTYTGSAGYPAPASYAGPPPPVQAP